MKAWLIAGVIALFAGGAHADSDTRAAPVPPAQDLHAMTPAQLTGREVWTSFDEDLGEVEKIVVEKQSRRPYVIVKVGGFLGLGVLLIAVPTSDIELRNERLIILTRVKGKKVGNEYPYTKETFAGIPAHRPVAELSREPKQQPSYATIIRRPHPEDDRRSGGS